MFRLILLAATAVAIIRVNEDTIYTLERANIHFSDRWHVVAYDYDVTTSLVSATHRERRYLEEYINTTEMFSSSSFPLQDSVEPPTFTIAPRLNDVQHIQRMLETCYQGRLPAAVVSPSVFQNTLLKLQDRIFNLSSYYYYLSKVLWVERIRDYVFRIYVDIPLKDESTMNFHLYRFFRRGGGGKYLASDGRRYTLLGSSLPCRRTKTSRVCELQQEIRALEGPIEESNFRRRRNYYTRRIGPGKWIVSVSRNVTITVECKDGYGNVVLNPGTFEIHLSNGCRIRGDDFELPFFEGPGSGNVSKILLLKREEEEEDDESTFVIATATTIPILVVLTVVTIIIIIIMRSRKRNKKKTCHAYMSPRPPPSYSKKASRESSPPPPFPPFPPPPPPPPDDNNNYLSMTK